MGIAGKYANTASGPVGAVVLVNMLIPATFRVSTIKLSRRPVDIESVVFAYGAKYVQGCVVSEISISIVNRHPFFTNLKTRTHVDF